jgi:hypothetical protein
MAQSIFKAQAEMRDLNAALMLRFKYDSESSVAIGQLNQVLLGADANGWPTAFYSVGGNLAEGQPVIGIRIRGFAVPAPDEFNQQQWAYAPHQLEIAYELNSSGFPIPELTDLFTAMFESTNTGICILQKPIANGTAVSVASMNAAVVAQELNNLYWANKGV